LNQNCLIVIAGPTASGKTDLSIRLAQYFKTEIVSADSRQFYRELTIGTAKPSSEQLRLAKHHFINSLSILDSYNASQYESDCIRLLDQLFLKFHNVILCGGSGMYIQAVLSGLDSLPPSDPDLRSNLNKKTTDELRDQLRIMDPEFYRNADLKNRVRLIRALEVCLITGKPFSTLRKKKPAVRNFNPLIIGIETDRSILYQKINKRVSMMMQEGLLNEVRHLLNFKAHPIMQTLGYAELIQYLDGKISLTEAEDLIRKNTRNYAKRQLTWFRKMNGINWFRNDEIQRIIEFIKQSGSMKKQGDV